MSDDDARLLKVVVEQVGLLTERVTALETMLERKDKRLDALEIRFGLKEPAA